MNETLYDKVIQILENAQYNYEIMQALKLANKEN